VKYLIVSVAVSLALLCSAVPAQEFDPGKPHFGLYSEDALKSFAAEITKAAWKVDEVECSNWLRVPTAEGLFNGYFAPDVPVGLVVMTAFDADDGTPLPCGLVQWVDSKYRRRIGQFWFGKWTATHPFSADIEADGYKPILMENLEAPRDVLTHVKIKLAKYSSEKASSYEIARREIPWIPRGQLRGRVTTEQGLPVAGATLKVGSGNDTNIVVSDQDGYYILPCEFDKDTTRLIVSHPDFPTVNSMVLKKHPRHIKQYDVVLVSESTYALSDPSLVTISLELLWRTRPSVVVDVATNYALYVEDSILTDSSSPIGSRLVNMSRLATRAENMDQLNQAMERLGLAGEHLSKMLPPLITEQLSRNLGDGAAEASLHIMLERQ